MPLLLTPWCQVVHPERKGNDTKQPMLCHAILSMSLPVTHENRTKAMKPKLIFCGYPSQLTSLDALPSCRRKRDSSLALIAASAFSACFSFSCWVFASSSDFRWALRSALATLFASYRSMSSLRGRTGGLLSIGSPNGAIICLT